VQVDRRSGKIRNAAGVKEKFRVEPALIPDYLALVGDSADGFPGLEGIGPATAARLIGRHGRIEDFPDAVLGERREAALLFKTLATLRSDCRAFRRRRRAQLERTHRGVCGMDDARGQRAAIDPRGQSRNARMMLERR
jgi:5'-3' exonuclease